MRSFCGSHAHPFNPNPISKCVVLVLAGLCVFKHLPTEIPLFITLLVFLYLNDYRTTVIKALIVYTLLSFVPNFDALSSLPDVLKIFLCVGLVIKLFMLPYLAGKFLVKGSSVSAILSSLYLLKVPQCVSIPLAVMFRFFPAFKEESAAITTAMRIRNISKRHPARYLEYVFVPLMIVSCNLADDITKAAECKAISNPGTKTHYTTIRFRVVDFLYMGIVAALIAGGIACLHCAI
ncbi:ABC transporter permease [Arcanobacterium sp. S3PF19]|nr:ABC transporter permease [Arcanobacterium sp. S3PF19]